MAETLPERSPWRGSKTSPNIPVPNAGVAAEYCLVQLPRQTSTSGSCPLGASRSQPAATLQRLTDDHALDLTPVAGVSSGKIVYVSNKTGGRDLWIHDPKTGN